MPTLGIDPKVDYAFKRVFGTEKNRDILIHLLNAILARLHRKPVVSVEILNPFSSKDAQDDKLSILDIKARDQSGRLLNIEMQMLAPEMVVKRFLYYWSQIYREQLKQGDEYTELQPTICIFFVNDVLFKSTTDHHLIFQVIDGMHGIVFTEDLELHTMELPKFNKSLDELSDPLDIWCYFLKHAESLDPSNLPKALDLPPVRRAFEELTMLTQDEIERERYLSRLQKQRDDVFFEKAYRLQYTAQGRTEGLAEGLIGQIQTFQQILRAELTPLEQLTGKSLTELQNMAEQLKGELLTSR